MNINIKLPEIPRIWLCGKVKYNESLIDKATEYYNHFDGLIWVVDGEYDKKHKLLESRKKDGEIIYRKWCGDHSIQMTEFLRSKKLKTFDWILSIDGNEEISKEFVKNIRNLTKLYQDNNIGVGLMGRPYLFQYYDDQVYTPNVHCWPNPLRGQFVNLPDRYIKKKEMNENSGLLNPFNYFFLTARTNECQMMYGKYGPDIVNYHETRRVVMRWYWQQNMNREFTLDSVLDYFTKVYNKEIQIDPIFLNYIEDEWPFADVFRLKILKHKWVEDFLDRNRRFSWSFREWLKSGDELQLIPSKKGKIIEYNERFGIRDE